MADAKTEGLRAAARELAIAMRFIAVIKTRRTAEAVNYGVEGEEGVVRGGHEGGAWGWEPIQALMFDNNKRHPLFGNKRKWYHQGYYSITEATVRQAGDNAAKAFADTALPILFKETGFTD